MLNFDKIANIIYFKVGKIVCLNDYVSRRLQIELDKKHELINPHMIHVRLMNINTFLQAIVESNLVNIHDYNKSLNDLNSSAQNKINSDNIHFVLPNVLENFFYV